MVRSLSYNTNWFINSIKRDRANWVDLHLSLAGLGLATEAIPIGRSMMSDEPKETMLWIITLMMKFLPWWVKTNINQDLYNQTNAIQQPSSKGHIKRKADWRTVDSPKNERTNLFCLLFTANKTNPFVRFLGETAFCFIWPLSNP